MNTNNLKIKLYFDATKVCLGGVANDWWLKDYTGDYWASDYFALPIGSNPVGQTLDELSQYLV